MASTSEYQPRRGQKLLSQRYDQGDRVRVSKMDSDSESMDTSTSDTDEPEEPCLAGEAGSLALDSGNMTNKIITEKDGQTFGKAERGSGPLIQYIDILCIVEHQCSTVSIDEGIEGVPFSVITKGSPANPDNIITWTPPATTDLEHARQTKQQRKHIASTEPFLHSPSTSVPRDQTSQDPIYISSDDESTFDTDEEPGSKGSPDMDDSKSDDTLPSLNTIITSLKKSSPILSPIGNLLRHNLTRRSGVANSLFQDLSIRTPTSHSYLKHRLVSYADRPQRATIHCFIPYHLPHKPAVQ